MDARPGTLEHRGAEPQPPVTRVGPWRWLRENLFNNWYNSLLTLLFAPLLSWIAFRALRFVFVTGRWRIVEVNLTTFMIGLFPRGEIPRLWAGLFVLALVAGLGMGIVSRTAFEEAQARGITERPSRTETLRRAGPVLTLLLVIGWLAQTALPLLLLAVAGVLGAAGFLTGRRLPRRVRPWLNLGVVAGLVAAYFAVSGFGGVAWPRWGGFLLTMFFTVGGIALSFPLGVLLALGRRSSLPAVRVICVGYIEVMRGVPLIALIFMSWLIIPFFLPPGAPAVDRVTRALIAFILFTAAYIAEIVRGGLQGVARGQREAAVAVGLTPWKTTRLVILPQALRSVIPAMIGQFISLYKDTSLVFVIGALELFSVARRVTQQPGFLGQGLHAETLVFVSLVFWALSYWMSQESQRLERRLGVGER